MGLQNVFVEYAEIPYSAIINAAPGRVNYQFSMFPFKNYIRREKTGILNFY